MEAMDIARQMAELGQPGEALRAYTLAVHAGGLTPEETLEAAVYLLQNGDNYKLPYTCFLNLYRQGQLREEALALLTGAFYEPNLKELQGRYERNVKLLKRYPYLFRKDFPAFEDLPIRFYPYSQDTYIPFFPEREEFGEFFDMKKPVITRNFFKDLEKPILASEVYSQYELEYLRDNVRPSEYVARENHVYLHYRDWGTFCSYLQCWNIRPLLKEEKIVFLIGEEIKQYPIDFKEHFGIDYSHYPVKPIGIREVQRVFWFSQLSSHNGIFFFAEVLDGHPNILATHALMVDKLEEILRKVSRTLDRVENSTALIKSQPTWPPRMLQELYSLKGRTDKDILVAFFLSQKDYADVLDPTARIAPALLFSPHFGNITYRIEGTEKGQAALYSAEYDTLRNLPVFKQFRYIKTIAPIRRPTTSYAAAVRYMMRKMWKSWEDSEKDSSFLDDELMRRILNRSFMVDPQDRLTRDSAALRFEDGKLNPEATFRALAAFLDIPYAETMTYCSAVGERNPENKLSDTRGFDSASVYETHSEFANDCERAALEFFLRDFYQIYGYDFQHYDGQPVDEDTLEKWVSGFTTLNKLMQESLEHALPEDAAQGSTEAEIKEYLERRTANMQKTRLNIFRLLRLDLHFVSKKGQPLHMMPLLKPDPAYLVQPLYH